MGGRLIGRSGIALAIALTALSARPGTAQHGGPWRVISDHKFPTIVAYDTTRVVPMPHGRFDVWERFTLHPPRHDPTGLVGSIIMRLVVDCSARQSALRSVARYAPGGKLISQTATFMVRDDDFTDETVGSVEASALDGVCAALRSGH